MDSGGFVVKVQSGGSVHLCGLSRGWSAEWADAYANLLRLPGVLEGGAVVAVIPDTFPPCPIPASPRHLHGICPWRAAEDLDPCESAICIEVGDEVLAIASIAGACGHHRTYSIRELEAIAAELRDHEATR